MNVNVQTAYDKTGTDKEAQLLDVREPGEWVATGVPRGAVLIPLGQVERRAPAELKPDRAVYVLCNSGNRSRKAADILVRLGFTEVYNISGGIQAWLHAGLPVNAHKA
jgi:rhodanese-related sulfurtransferase